MSNFKKQVEKDIFGVFLDFDKFGEYHRVDRKNILCVLDDWKLKERQGGEELSVAESSVMFYAASKDVEWKQAGNTINIDGKEYIVDDLAEDMGVTTLTLHQHTVI